MGFSLRNLLDEAVAQINPFDHGQTAATVAQQHPVFTRPIQPQQPMNNGGGLQVVNQPNNMPTLNQAPAPPPPTFHLNVGVAAPQPLHIGNTAIMPGGGTTNAQAPVTSTPSLADHLHSILSGTVSGVNNNVVKPIVNTAKVPIDLGTALGSELAGGSLDQQLKAANALENAWNGSLPGMVTNIAKPVVKGVANVPQAIAGEIASQSSDPYVRQAGIQAVQQAQQKAFNTNDSGKIAKQIGGSVTGLELMLAAPEVASRVAGVVAPAASSLLSSDAAATGADAATNYATRAALKIGNANADTLSTELANPVARTALNTALNAGTQAPIGYGFGASGEMATNPNASLSDINKAGISNAEMFAALGGAGSLAHDTTPKIISMAKDTAAKAPEAVKSVAGNLASTPLNEAGSVPIPKIISNATDAVKQRAGDIITGKPYRNISDAELASAQKVRNTMQGYGSSMDLTEQDMANYRNIQNKIGAEVNDHSAVDNVIGARRTYDTQQAYKNSPEVKQGGYAKIPGKGQPAEEPVAPEPSQNSVDSSVNGSTVPVDKNGQMPADFLQQDPGQVAVNKAQATAEKVAEQSQKTAAKVKPATGRVDKQLNQIEQARQSVIDTAAEELRQQQTPIRKIRSEVLQRGGISSSDYESLPKGVIRKSGMSADKMAQELGFTSEDALIEELQKPVPKPLSKASAQTIVAQQLENGSHPYSADYKEITDALKQRQDELSQYPNGKYRQVKVTEKPNQMSDAELASLSNTPEGKVKPAGNQPVKVDPKTELRNSDAERNIAEGLKNGKTTDELLKQYMDETGVPLQKAAHDINRVAKESGLNTDVGKNPLDGKVPLGATVEKGDWKQALLNSRFVQYKEHEAGSKALDSYDQLKAHDQNLLRNIEGDTVSEVAKQAKNPKAFKQAAADIRNYFDTRHAYDRGLGIDVGYRTNYIRHFFDKAEEDAQQASVSDQVKVGGANKNPGYTKARTQETLAKNVRDALERDIKGSSFNHAKLAFENGLVDALDGKVSHGELVRDKATGEHYTQLKHGFGRDLAVPDSIAKEINRRAWQNEDGQISQTYDRINHGFKYLKLSGGLFHAFTESGNFIGQQLGSLKLAKDPIASAKMAKVFFSPKAMHGELVRMADNHKANADSLSTLDRAQLSGLKTQPKEIAADVEVNALAKGSSKAAKLTGIQQMHDATFQREIPYAKLKLFEQKTEGLDTRNPADMAKMRKIAQGDNALFGGFDREIHGVTPKWFKIFQKGTLAFDFTEAKYTTLYNALSKWGADSPEGRMAREAVLGKAVLFGLLATAGAAAGGDYQGKSGVQVAKDALGKMIDPNFEMGGYKVGFPKTHVSEVVDAVKPTKSNGKAWNGSGLLSYAQDRTAALPSELIQLLSNKNYYGQPLYGTNTKKNGGGKISGVQAISNIAQTALPIPVGQAATTAQGKQNPAAAVANVIGFKAKPNTANSVTFQGQQTQLTDKQTGAYTNQINTTLKSMQQQLTSSNAYKNASPNDQAKMMSDLKKNVTSAVNRDYASKNKLGQFAPDYTGSGGSASTKEQDILSGKINPDAYTPGAKNTDSYAVSQFKQSGKRLTTIGNQTYYKTSDGSVKHENTYVYNTGIQSAKIDFAMNRSKAAGDYSGWIGSARQKLALIQDQIAHHDPQTEQKDIIDLQKQAADLGDQISKYQGYGGGFTKPKSAKSQVNAIKNSYTPYKAQDFNDINSSLRSILKATASSGSYRQIKAKQIVKI